MQAPLSPVIAASLAAGQQDGNFSFNRLRMAIGRPSTRKARVNLVRMATPNPETGEAVVIRHPSKIHPWMPTPEFWAWCADELAENPTANMTEEERQQEAMILFAGLKETP